MGAQLSSPVTATATEDGSLAKLRFGAASMQGWRKKQEDVFSCIPNFDEASSTALFAIYDGHGGPEVAKYCASRMPEVIRHASSFLDGDVESGLVQAFSELDSSLIDAEVVEKLKELALLSELSRETSTRTSTNLPSIKEEDKSCRHSSSGGTKDTADKNGGPEAAGEDRDPGEDDGDWGFGYDRNAALDEWDTAALGGPEKCTNLPADAAATPATDAPGVTSGTAAAVVLVRGGTDLYVAHVGNTRCVLCSAGAAVDLTTDHRPDNAKEEARIARAGGRVTRGSCGSRIDNGLNISRSIGDHAYKMRTHLPRDEQTLISLPDVAHRKLTEDDQFLVIASHGIWSCKTSQWIVNFIADKLSQADAACCLSDICSQIVHELLCTDPRRSDSGTDNMTCILIVFTPPTSQQSTAGMAGAITV